MNETPKFNVSYILLMQLLMRRRIFLKTSKINIQLIVYLREEDQLLKFRNKFIAKRIGIKTLASLLAFGMALGSPMAAFADDGVVAENTVQAKRQMDQKHL